jgi:hypothetical protein
MKFGAFFIQYNEVVLTKASMQFDAFFIAKEKEEKDDIHQAQSKSSHVYSKSG